MHIIIQTILSTAQKSEVENMILIVYDVIEGKIRLPIKQL